MFIPIERQTSILKMGIREVFLMKPKHQYHLSQRGELMEINLNKHLFPTILVILCKELELQWLGLRLEA